MAIGMNNRDGLLKASEYGNRDFKYVLLLRPNAFIVLAQTPESLLSSLFLPRSMLESCCPTNTNIYTSPVALFARAKEQNKPLYGKEGLHKNDNRSCMLISYSLCTNGQIQQVGISIACPGIRR